MHTAATSQALVPNLLNRFSTKLLGNISAWFLGIILLSALAQVAIPLPWTPVPITGQTFAVAFISLSWGRKQAISILLGYLALGALGFPIFAAGKSGLSLGPTLGYLIGMLAASFVVGGMADKGFSRSFWRAWLAATTGSIFIFSFGLIGLSFFIPKAAILSAGLWPFLPGDILKNILAATLVWRVHKSLK
jgi:biotin transport system substrate-specific component